MDNVEKTALLNQFIWAHVTKDSRNEFRLLYNWDTDKVLPNTLDGPMALEWFRNNNKDIEEREITIHSI